MPDIFAPIAVWLAKILPSMVARVMGALGLGLLTFTGVDTAMTALLNTIQQKFGGIAADIIGIAALAGFDVFISIVLSAYVGVITLMVVAGSVKRFAFGATNGGGE